MAASWPGNCARSASPTPRSIRATLKFILRDFSESGLKDKAELLETTVKRAMLEFPRSSYRLAIAPQYRNMKDVLDRHPQVVAYAMEAVHRAGLSPVKASVRGGTHGSRLSAMGLPCPNIFAGEHAFHSRLEWVSVQEHAGRRAHYRAPLDSVGGIGLRLAVPSPPHRSRGLSRPGRRRRIGTRHMRENRA